MRLRGHVPEDEMMRSSRVYPGILLAVMMVSGEMEMIAEWLVAGSICKCGSESVTTEDEGQ